MAAQVEIKSIIGALDLDSPLESIGKGFHRDSRNVLFRGVPPNRRVEIVPGFIAVTNPLLPATGVNKTIADRNDAVNKRIYFFNYNSLGTHGIYLFNTISATFQRLLEIGVNTTDDDFGFSAEVLYNIDIIYGDSLQGNLLYYIDSLGRPSKININRAITGGYGTIQRSFLDVAKEPASIPPYIVYEGDPTNTVNNCRKKLFRAKVRWVFDDNDKAVTSSQSEMPIPFGTFDQAVDADPTRNCRLAITYQTGPANVKKIEIYISNSLGNVMSDFYLVASIDKAAESVSDNDISTYLFYNNKAYTDGITLQESGQLFDYVPQWAKAQSVLNGNVLDYSNITEGYPNLTNFTSVGGNSTITKNDVTPYYSGNYFSNLIAAQNGESGFEVGVIHIVVRGLILTAFALDTFVVFMTDGSTVNYTLTLGDDPAAIIEGLRVDALSKGYTIVTVSDNDLSIFKNGISLARTQILSTYVNNSILNNSFFAYDWSSKHGFALVYEDEKGRTNGAVYTNGFSVTSLAYQEADPSNPYIQRYVASIYHQPPSWAHYFHWVRTNNLSKLKIQQWVTDRTFKDTASLSGIVKYAYMSIESLNEFVQKNPGSPLGYGFTTGDRIKFMKRHNADSTTANVYGDTKDFEVVASLTNPTINGEVKSGQFIKIVLPTVDGAFDFGTTGFANYFIELYTPAQPLSNNLNIYSEFGERYAIGNPGASNRFHQGMLQNQSTDYVTPATYGFFKGDYYVRLRSIQAGNIYSYNMVNGNLTAGRILFGLTFIDSTYTDSNITTQSVALANISGNTPSGGINPASDTRWFLKAITNTSFRIRGNISINFTTTVPGDVWRIFILNRFNERQYLVNDFSAGASGVYSFTIDTITTLEDDRIFLIAEGGERPLNVLSSELTFTIDHVISQKMIDQNFSDYFASAVNSNGRGFVFDENANQVTYPTMHRWSLAYQEDTNINQTSRFYPENFDTVNRSYGPIMRTSVWQQKLIFFQERRCGQTGIFQKMITNNDGVSELVTTNSIITKDNVQYYDGQFGVSNCPESVVQSGYVHYFVDPVKAKILRLSNDGVTDLTEKYLVQTWGSQNLPQYLNPGSYPFGGSQKILGTFNIRPDNVGEYLLLRQGAAVEGETMGFEENYNSFYGKIDIDCDAIVCAENVLYAFKNGVLWKQRTAAYNNFFGVQKTAILLLNFNDQMSIKKIFMGLAYQSYVTWDSPVVSDVETDTVNSQTGLKQQSKIMSQDYDILESPSRYAAFNRDGNSLADGVVAIWEGDYLVGHYITVRFRYAGSAFASLYAPYITYRTDPRNL